jgi:hypothetical protein
MRVEKFKQRRKRQTKEIGKEKKTYQHRFIDRWHYNQNFFILFLELKAVEETLTIDFSAI